MQNTLTSLVPEMTMEQLLQLMTKTILTIIKIVTLRLVIKAYHYHTVVMAMHNSSQVCSYQVHSSEDNDYVPRLNRIGEDMQVNIAFEQRLLKVNKCVKPTSMKGCHLNKYCKGVPWLTLHLCEYVSMLILAFCSKHHCALVPLAISMQKLLATYLSEK